MAGKVNLSQKKVEMPVRDPKERARVFQEVATGYTPEMAMEEATRCLHCKAAPCVKGCPVGVQIPNFIQEIVKGDFAKAYQVITQTNRLPAVCGRVCPQENQCEGLCVRGKKGEPVGIGRLERFAADYARNHPEETNSAGELIVSNGKKVAVIAVDFGWYYFLTKPFFYILDFLYNFIGNMGWAILLFAALLRFLMFPIANKSYESMSKMKKVQPRIKELQERYGDDKMKLQQETLELYRREKINPAAGCLPMLIQIPVFFSLYKVLNISIEIRHAPFIGWIKDLSAPDPLTLSAWTHLPVPGLLDIGVWPILMGLTMWIQQKLNPAPTNKDQARMFAMMPVIFTFMLGHFASGLVIYWTLSNILSIIQQKAIMKKNGVK